MDFFLLLSIVGVVAFWVDAMRSRETAVRHARNACNRYELQLLDETVALQKLTLRRDPEGRVKFRRRYTFDFSPGDDLRRSGWLEMLGPRLTNIELEMDGHMLHEPVEPPRLH